MPAMTDCQTCCPFCNIDCGSSTDLEIHIYTLHVETLEEEKSAIPEQNGAAAEDTISELWNCPICPYSSKDPVLLQEHANSHFPSPVKLPQTENEEKADSMVAQEIERREKMNKAFKEHQELKKQHGMEAGQGGYLSCGTDRLDQMRASGRIGAEEHQRQRQLLRADVTSGVDCGSTCTKGVIGAVRRLLTGNSRVREWYLVTEMSHYSGGAADRGWGCGYRNSQMLLSSAAADARFYQSLFSGQPDRMPSVPKLQRLIEDAWQAGYDPAGSVQLGGRLSGTRKWIGVTDVYTMLTSLNVDCQLIDFHRSTGDGRTHPLLFDWVLRYFRQGSAAGNRIHPLILQHQNHSRTVVGCELYANGEVKLVIFDPSVPSHVMNRMKPNISGKQMTTLRRTLRGLRHAQYQILAIRGVLTDAQKQDRKLITSERQPP